ncbi:hypothetical protein F4802DRAFT_617960 [Xylaria palmicola]|nr:hypothetical protein F4802DRAFT_617960 [Xylaria palmicola]
MMATRDGESDPVETYSDAQLSEHIAALFTKQRLDKDSIPRLTNLSAAYLSKRYFSYEELQDAVLAIELARSLNVRTPRIRRTVPVPQEKYYECVFDRVQGVTLMDAWADLGWVTTIRLAFQLRGMIRRMRGRTNPTAGSLGTGIARTFWLEDDAYGVPRQPSAHTIMSLVNVWYNMKMFPREKAKTKEQHESSSRGPLDLSQPLVFTHHDLAPRNMMIDSAGDLCLVDWDYAGWYPPCFEHAGMHNFWPPLSWGWMGELRWKVFAWIATGFYTKEKRVLTNGRRKATGFPLARRFNIEAGVTPSIHPVED